MPEATVLPSAVLERIPTRTVDVGGLPVRRALPTRARRLVGAWCFLDQAGPVQVAPGAGIHVGPHPHIGLQTFTWMLDGEVMHRDSLGSELVIRAGQINLMTAGHGIVHTEESLDQTGGAIHAAQLWIALPESRRHGPAAFDHYPELPLHTQDGVTLTLLAGQAFGAEAPTRIYSPLIGMDIAMTPGSRTELPLAPDFEHAVLCLRGSASVEGHECVPGELIYLGAQRTQITLSATQDAQLLLIGGAPFQEDVLLWWNFVGRSTEELSHAATQWNAGDSRFGTVAGNHLPRLVAPSLEGVQLRPTPTAST